MIPNTNILVSSRLVRSLILFLTGFIYIYFRNGDNVYDRHMVPYEMYQTVWEAFLCGIFPALSYQLIPKFKSPKSRLLRSSILFGTCWGLSAIFFQTVIRFPQGERAWGMMFLPLLIPVLIFAATLNLLITNSIMGWLGEKKVIFLVLFSAVQLPTLVHMLNLSFDLGLPAFDRNWPIWFWFET